MMIWLELLMVALLAMFAALFIHAAMGKGTPVSGVPKLLWMVALLALDPLVAAAYAVFGVAGVARHASWRRWLVYSACALSLMLRLWPLSVPPDGVYPRDSAHPSALPPGLDISLAAQIGSTNGSTSSSLGRGNGWVIRTAAIVGDGHPVSAACVDQVANTLLSLGVRSVHFVQSEDAQPAPAADLLVSVSVQDVFAVDVLAVAHWSGVVRVSMGYRPFSDDNWVSAYDGFTDAGGGRLGGSWRISSTRVGPVLGAARYEHAVSQLTDLAPSIRGMIGEARPGGRIEIRGEGVDGTWQEPGLDALLAPYSPRLLVRGAGFLRDAQAVWKVDLGDSPRDALLAMAKQLRAEAWQQVTVGDSGRANVWRLHARRDVDGDRHYLRVMPAIDETPQQSPARAVFDGKDGSPPEPDLPMQSGYIVWFHDRFGDDRLGALVERYLDSREDDFMLRLLGKSVPDARYEEWRTQVLAGDVGVQNLLCVARNDNKRERLESGQALIKMASWVASQSPQTSLAEAELRKMIQSAATSNKIAPLGPKQVPPMDMIERGGIPILTDEWRQIPYLALQHSNAGSQAPPMRRFVVIDQKGQPTLLHIERIDTNAEEQGLRIGSGGRHREVRKASHLDAGVVGVDMEGGRFEVRKVAEHVEVRWRPTIK
ncbi:MAG: hypothetical protein AB8H80_09830 [Planctomycetota bacterium]